MHNKYTQEKPTFPCILFRFQSSTEVDCGIWPTVKCGRADVATGKMRTIFADKICGRNG